MYVDVVEVLGVVVAESVVQMGESDESVGEVGVVLQLWLSPLHLAQCCHTWQSHILHVLECRHILSPYVCLNAYDVTSLVGSQFLRHRFVRIYALQGQIATDGKRFVGLVKRLVVVEVEVAVGSHYHIVVLLGCCNASGFASP